MAAQPIPYKRIWLVPAAICLCLLALPSSPASAQAETSETLRVGPAQVRAVVEEAIAFGVPLYNGGQAQACAAVYRVALTALRDLAPTQVGGPAIDRALRLAATQDATEAAWTLRYALDAVYASTEGITSMEPTDLRIDFDNSPARWRIVNDNVMGGVSRGGLERTADATGLFTGQLSMRNNGGFSSVRADVSPGSLSGYDGVELRVRGDGRLYTLLAGPGTGRGSWQGTFRAGEQWQTVRVPFDEMQLSIRGWQPPSSPALPSESIAMLGLMIADKRTAPFRLEVDWIRGYTEGVAVLDGAAPPGER